MIRDYGIVSPSLDGVLSHESLTYEGLRRPVEIIRAFDSPSGKSGKDGKAEHSEHEQKILEQYFQDLYGIFMKRLSHFFVESNPLPDDALKLQAMLQEMIKIKGLLGRGKGEEKEP